MTAPFKKRSESENNNQNPKDRNYVFAQIMKIEKINKDTEKRNKEKKEEIKNSDIMRIIEETKK